MDAHSDAGTRPELRPEPRTESGGDPACWLNRVCDNCGRFVDDEFAEVCPACGAKRGPDTGPDTRRDT